MYLDVKGLVTCGVGNLLPTAEAAMHLAWRHPDGSLALPSEVKREWQLVSNLQPGWGPQYYRDRTTLRLTDADVDELVLRQLLTNGAWCSRHWPDWESWPADAQMGALSRAWAAGVGLEHWPKFDAACNARDWLTAGEESQLRTDGNPGVVPRNAAQRVAFCNAAAVDRDPGKHPPERLWWPVELELETADTDPAPPPTEPPEEAADLATVAAAMVRRALTTTAERIRNVTTADEDEDD